MVGIHYIGTRYTFKGAAVFLNKKIKLFSDNQDPVIFYLLAYIIEGTRKRKKASDENDVPQQITLQARKAVKLKERRDAFIIHVEVI